MLVHISNIRRPVAFSRLSVFSHPPFRSCYFHSASPTYHSASEFQPQGHQKATTPIFSMKEAKDMSGLRRLIASKIIRPVASAIGGVRPVSTIPSGVNHHHSQGNTTGLSASSVPSANGYPEGYGGVRVQQLDGQGKHRAFIALGSNLGDRVQMIERACLEMDKDSSMRVIRTSGLWETKAMYYTEQNNFLNGACEVETSLGPVELLDKLQAIENSLGRIKLIEKGPRCVDLDILLYDNEVFHNERLTIPHTLMLEREFVLRPLCDLIPHATLPPLLGGETFAEYLSKLQPSDPSLSTFTPISHLVPPITALRTSRSTRVMSVLNLTPDSFSDGGCHSPTDHNYLRELVKSHIASGASIIDIGGQSTRPNAPQFSAEEELSRILPAVSLIKASPEAHNCAISIDTYRASVAKAAVDAGAHMINDVSAGQMDPDMLATLASLGCTVVLMHMRGTPGTMTSSKNTFYTDGIIETVGRELRARVSEAEVAGVRRWRIILDPGIGFAKTQGQNLELLRRLGELRAFPGLEGFPWLVGTSRKGFIGTITGVEKASERTWGTAATVAAAIQGGADIVRVHDVEEMTAVTKMADAIWRLAS